MFPLEGAAHWKQSSSVVFSTFARTSLFTVVVGYGFVFQWNGSVVEKVIFKPPVWLLWLLPLTVATSFHRTVSSGDTVNIHSLNCAVQLLLVFMEGRDTFLWTKDIVLSFSFQNTGKCLIEAKMEIWCVSKKKNTVSRKTFPVDIIGLVWFGLVDQSDLPGFPNPRYRLLTR